MGLAQTLRRWFGREEVDPTARVEAEAEAKRIAYDRDSIRLSQQMATRGAAGPITPTPDLLHPDERDR